MKEERKKPPGGKEWSGRLAESQEPDGGRGAPQPATSNDQARADEIVRKQRQQGPKGNE